MNNEISYEQYVSTSKLTQAAAEYFWHRDRTTRGTDVRRFRRRMAEEYGVGGDLQAYLGYFEKLEAYGFGKLETFLGYPYFKWSKNVRTAGVKPVISLRLKANRKPLGQVLKAAKPVASVRLPERTAEPDNRPVRLVLVRGGSAQPLRLDLPAMSREEADTLADAIHATFA